MFNLYMDTLQNLIHIYFDDIGSVYFHSLFTSYVVQLFCSKGLHFADYSLCYVFDSLTNNMCIYIIRILFISFHIYSYLLLWYLFLISMI